MRKVITKVGNSRAAPETSFNIKLETQDTLGEQKRELNDPKDVTEFRFKGNHVEHQDFKEINQCSNHFIKSINSFSAHLVPVFSFGENEVFDQVENSRGTWLRWTQERLQSIMGISLPLFHARGIFQYSFGLMPYRKPIHTIGEQNAL